MESTVGISRLRVGMNYDQWIVEAHGQGRVGDLAYGAWLRDRIIQWGMTAEQVLEKVSNMGSNNESNKTVDVSAPVEESNKTESNNAEMLDTHEAPESNKFDKAAYQREYMRKKRAEDQS